MKCSAQVGSDKLIPKIVIIYLDNLYQKISYYIHQLKIMIS